MSSKIFKEFFNCFSLPTIILNKNLKIIFKYKYDSESNYSIYTTSVIYQLETVTFTPNVIVLNIEDNVQYTCIMFYHYDNSPMYILIGPYILTPINIGENKNNIMYITQHSLDGIIAFHSYLINNHSYIKYSDTTNSPIVEHAISYIEKNYTNEISMNDICKDLNINKCYFCSVFKKETGLTFINYLNSFKVEKSKELLKNPTLSLLDISLSVGFNNQSYYSTVFKKITLKTPLEFREEFLSKRK